MNRKKLTFFVVLGITLFFTILFTYYASKLGFFTKKTETTAGAQNKSIVFEQPRLKIFDDTFYLNLFPDTIRIHYPYFLVVKPYEIKTSIYNISLQKKEKDLAQVVLDYDGQNVVFNKSGYKTFFNAIDLLTNCDSAYIKSPQEVLCITKVSQDKMDNKLVSINPQTKMKKDIYVSKNLLTSVSFIKNTLYIGENNIETRQNFLTINTKQIPVNSFVSIVYPMQNNIYFASFKTSDSQSKAMYYLVKDGKEALIKEVGKIIFYLP